MVGTAQVRAACVMRVGPGCSRALRGGPKNQTPKDQAPKDQAPKDQAPKDQALGDVVPETCRSAAMRLELTERSTRRCRHEGTRLPRSRRAQLGGGTGPAAPGRHRRRSSASTPSRSAAPTCTSSRATSPRSRRARSSATRRSAPSRRSAAPSARSRPGDRVLVSCIAGCGTCRFCREGHYGQCLGGGGWALGHTIDGVQAEYARVPFADLSLHPLPQGVTRRGGGAARRHPADQLRGRRPQRRRRARATRS